MNIQLVNCEKHILDEIEGDLKKICKRDDVAQTYAWCLVSDEEIDWRRINEAIIKRWSMSALTYIKTKAWKLVAERQTPGVTH